MVEEVMDMTNASAILNFVKNVSPYISSDVKNITTLKNFLEKIKQKYFSKIIYGLYLLRLSSHWELSDKLHLGNMLQIRRTTNEMIEKGIITILKTDTEEYEITTRFWKKHHPTSPYNPSFFLLSHKWKDIVNELEPHFMKWFDSSELAAIRNRGISYDNHYEMVKQQLNLLKKKREESIGNCHNCGALISKDWLAGKDYHNFEIGRICNICTKKYTHMISKWRSATE